MLALSGAEPNSPITTMGIGIAALVVGAAAVLLSSGGLWLVLLYTIGGIPPA